ncbi:MAG: mechanosensitive ion channel family protein, partial [Spirochaetia bacterium]
FLQPFIEVLNQNMQILSISLPFSFTELIIGFLLPIVLFILIYKLLLFTVRRVLDQVNAEQDLAKNVYNWTRFALRIAFVIAVSSLTGRLFGAEILSYWNQFYQILSEPFFESGTTRISVITIFLTIPIFYLAAWISKVIKKFVDQNILGNTSIDESKRFSISNLTRYAVTTIVLLVGLSIIGIDLSALAVIFGVLGIGIGFGLQEVVANLFGGIVIIFARPIKEGDRILVKDQEGTVTQIKMLASVVTTLTNECIIVPNSQLINNMVHNYTLDDRSIIIVSNVQVHYNTDLDTALRILRDVGERIPYGLKVPSVDPKVVSFDSSGISMSVWTWIKDVKDKMKAQAWMNLEIWRAFKNAGIQIPYPQMDLYVKEIPENTV